MSGSKIPVSTVMVLVECAELIRAVRRGVVCVWKWVTVEVVTLDLGVDFSWPGRVGFQDGLKWGRR